MFTASCYSRLEFTFLFYDRNLLFSIIKAMPELSFLNPNIPIILASRLPGEPREFIAKIVSAIENIEQGSCGIHKANRIWMSSMLYRYAQRKWLKGISAIQYFKNAYDIETIEQSMLPGEFLVVFDCKDCNMLNPDSIDWLLNLGTVYRPWAIRIIKTITRSRIVWCERQD